MSGAQYNVVSCGAKGDGSTDDTNAIQCAINAANSAGGGTVYFPPGTYIASSLTIYAQIVLLGAGIRATTIQLKGGTTGHLFSGGAAGSEIHSFSFQQMALDGAGGDGRSGGYFGGDGIHVFAFGFTTFNLVVHGFGGHGIWSSCHGDSNSISDFDSMEAMLLNTKVHECNAGGIYWDGPHDSVFANLIVYQNGPSSGTTTAGIETTTAEGMLVAVNCHVWGNNHMYAWKLGGGAMLSNCQGEGASASQVLVLQNGTKIVGGQYYAAGKNMNSVGVEIGSSTQAVAGSMIFTEILNCGGGAFKFTNDGGSGVIGGLVWQPSGNAFAGQQPQESNRIDVTVTGSASSGGLTGDNRPYTMPGGVRITNGGVLVEHGGGIETRGNNDTDLVFSVCNATEPQPHFRVYASGFMDWGDGSGAYDAAIYRAGSAHPLLVVDKALLQPNLGISITNAASASGSPGTLVQKFPVYNSSGSLLGYVPIYQKRWPRFGPAADRGTGTLYPGPMRA